jgi:hypothetical protein
MPLPRRGSHGGAWIHNVESNEELNRLLAMSPIYNYAIYQVLALAEMTDPETSTGRRSPTSSFSNRDELRHPD